MFGKQIASHPELLAEFSQHDRELESDFGEHDKELFLFAGHMKVPTGINAVRKKAFITASR